jgi:hypothetical protein
MLHQWLLRYEFGIDSDIGENASMDVKVHNGENVNIAVKVHVNENASMDVKVQWCWWKC